MSKENIKKRFRNWRTWVAAFSLIGFLFTKFGIPEVNNFLEELLPYVFAVGVSLGIWTDHKEKGEDA
ncbi:hypothetical protein [Bacillus pseudomycoides]|uniref:Uncharacterized protein n=1 Tax=Bacillus pseudomycoides TaxID=64104 RepID=A0A2B5HMA9_9BACI|nr:hypothetical protein [Bacillus pseudomycoides]PEA82704.1 hypothetical protein CON99_15445 [Bacillus pseudomycoides]PED70163.1 hypothetical protein CON97_20840 [Bacillus pseudomycoides]PEI41414.1 hypothetical protein CN620_12755 [Bacillus pseudomycoides]PEJ72612.1 hypothetical protein CN680_21615 [Bacillus pseudomycoides]PEM10901.1 hypothetical protein CN628_22105 [Bacillus pseudomycoides]